MTTLPSLYMETVSLSDDAPGTVAAASDTTVLDVVSIKSQIVQPEVLKPSKETAEICVPVLDSATIGDGTLSNSGTSNGQSTGTQHRNSHQNPQLPPLRMLTQKLPIEERDYVDPTLFSPEVSRHAMEVAHRRAKVIANEVKEMRHLDKDVKGATTTKFSAVEAVGIISGAFVTSFQRAKHLIGAEKKEYNLLSGSSPITGMSKLDDPDTDGDGLQLSPDALRNDTKRFRTPPLKPALKRISVYSAAALESNKKFTQMHQPMTKMGIQWHEDVLDDDEEFIEDKSDSSPESLSLIMDEENSSARPPILNFKSKCDEPKTPRSKKKRKKLVRSMMRRLTPPEKEELYRQRPDLMIVPNWAQKYREELAGEDSTHWNTWLLAMISVLVVLLLVFLLLIVRQRAAASAQRAD
ncbi:hypothetical protein CCR75_008704 [Bremia lactucae]|uniref:Uncharacterized protein n=1 Tax=Bremia lactucae TaxID=4779 RepID=A0A976IKW4_BRELC|nr:hypothetical protein CCR75_008704 [Bremia lactucae]